MTAPDPHSPLGPITPLPRPAEELVGADVVLFGGSFDPVHRAHVDLGEQVRAGVEARPGVRAAWLAYVPAARSPHKNQGPVGSDADRTAMLRLALDGKPRTLLWTDELDRAARAGGPSYTVDTLRRLAEVLRSAGAGSAAPRLHLLIGADQALAFHRWREPHAILALADPIVLLRAPAEHAESLLERVLAEGRWSAAEAGAWRRSVLVLPTDDVSSTQIRLAAARGDWAYAQARTPAGACAYMREHRVYAERRPVA
ncbi:MAG: nicotinate-nicotinamide nucleotide adenylyltransferase [Polaromonas sp.]